VGHGQGVFGSKHSTAIKKQEEPPMNTAIVTTTAATDSPFIKNLKQQRQQPQTAKETIALNVQVLIQQLEEGHSEGLTAYLTALGKFHRYSFSNILEIARQKAVT
jgi:excinuclease UvrABC helicase subunit UvrB